jgi:Meiotically up-regulated gene 113
MCGDNLIAPVPTVFHPASRSLRAAASLACTNPLLRWTHAQDHASSASKPFKVGYRVGRYTMPGRSTRFAPDDFRRVHFCPEFTVERLPQDPAVSYLWLVRREAIRHMKPTAATTSSPIQDKWWRSPAILYFIAAGSPSVAIKIGVTTRATFLHRFRSIQSSNHEHLELIGAIAFDTGDFPMKDCEDCERLLHLRFPSLQRFKPYTRGAGWFTASPELLAHIRKIATPPEQLGRALSTTGPTSHKTPKNLCERDALPTELYPRSLSPPVV